MEKKKQNVPAESLDKISYVYIYVYIKYVTPYLFYRKKEEHNKYREFAKHLPSL